MMSRSAYASYLIVFISVVISCSVSAATNDSRMRRRRMAGGSDVPDGVYPYVVSIQVHSRHVCAGTIVSATIILTAAHCILDGYKYTVRAGSTTISSGGSIHTVENFIRHEGYKRIEIGDNTLAMNDLALIQVKPPMTTDNVQKVQLIGQNESVIEGSDVVLVGWGATRKRKEGDFDYKSSWDRITSILISYDKSHYSSEKLRTASLKALPKEKCADKPLSDLLVKQICVGSPRASSCKGDSGGPLLVNGRQAGVASSCGKECGSENSRSIFSSIAYYRNWIDENTKKLEFSPTDSVSYPIFR